MTFEQAGFDARCEWGPDGVAQLAPVCDVVVVVDVLSFTTTVDIATSRGATVFPYAARDESAVQFATSLGAIFAGGRRGTSTYSLSPQSVRTIPRGTRLVLPSPNGATLSLATGSTPTLAGCLRNARAVALAARQFGPRVGVVPAGERWPDGSLRPCFEDWIGAGAIISHLGGPHSPEAMAAAAAFRAAAQEIPALLQACGSGRELIEQGFDGDVALAAEVDTSDNVPVLVNAGYVALGSDSRR